MKCKQIFRMKFREWKVFSLNRKISLEQNPFLMFITIRFIMLCLLSNAFRIKSRPRKKMLPYWKFKGLLSTSLSLYNVLALNNWILSDCYILLINMLGLLENFVKVIMDMLCFFNNANWIYRK